MAVYDNMKNKTQGDKLIIKPL